ncbi:MAG: hypothetical protein OXP08_01375 [bacterium]|nr:hypothetical protein [bacterium]
MVRSRCATFPSGTPQLRVQLDDQRHDPGLHARRAQRNGGLRTSASIRP